ncbi:transposase [Bacillus cereus group sp. BfR-BA-01363]|uniref:RNA-guided endonuclease InsQ/TnpB family protein n=1 Tax=Bacillus cereus group sp. BfR-BA-01363 TaxID=3094882 RepID=UPI0029C21EB1|nr:transposase [Bacillus cereus group sp. BfR-BA-01363]MDX5853712.1 transposase [Bacillus cereus group sp. BfR-BA-01363]
MKHLSKDEYFALRELCFLAKNMYNVGLYHIRQHFFLKDKFLSYNENYQLSKKNENYKLLNSNVAQQMLKEVDGAFRSFFGLLKLKRQGKYDKKVTIPHYAPKDGYMTLIIGQIRIKENGVLDIPMSPAFKRQYGKVRIQTPSNLRNKKIKEIRIIPKFNARFFEIQYTYEVKAFQREINPNHVLAIDFGVNNLATCVTNHGKSFLVDGKRLKAINQWYNKQYTKMTSVRNKLFGTNRSLTKKEIQLIEKRNHRVRDIINKTARIIVNYCTQYKIGTMVVGRNKGMKQRIHIGKKNNQTFVQIPIGILICKLQYLCEQNQIRFVEQEESYTSKSDFFSNDILPIHEKGSSETYHFSGKRISRGQYASKTGMILNADVNGALNIMRKSNLGGQALMTLQNRGNLDMPMRIRVS